MLRLVFVLQRLHLLNDILSRQAPILVEIALTMIAEGAPSPVATARGQVREDPHRHKVAVQREAIEIRQRERRHLLGINLSIHMDAGLIPVDEIGHRRFVALTAEGFEQPEQCVLPFVQNRRVEDAPEKHVVLGQFLLQPRDDVPTDGHVNAWKRLLDHLAERQPGQELHLGPDRDPHYIRRVLADGRQDQLPANVPVHIDLVIVQASKHFA